MDLSIRKASIVFSFLAMLALDFTNKRTHGEAA